MSMHHAGDDLRNVASLQLSLFSQSVSSIPSKLAVDKQLSSYLSLLLCDASKCACIIRVMFKLYSSPQVEGVLCCLNSDHKYLSTCVFNSFIIGISNHIPPCTTTSGRLYILLGIREIGATSIFAGLTCVQLLHSTNRCQTDRSSIHICWVNYIIRCVQLLHSKSRCQTPCPIGYLEIMMSLLLP